MAGRNCCCCKIKLEDLPEANVYGWTPFEWSFNEVTCCATKIFFPTITPPPTFIDGGDTDASSFNEDYVGDEYIIKESYTPILGQGPGGTADPPTGSEVDCAPCISPIKCSTQTLVVRQKSGERFGLLYVPWIIRLTICYVDVVCPYGVKKKYLVTSQYVYKRRTLAKRYTINTAVGTISHVNCCDSAFDREDVYTDTTDPRYDFNDPRFWGFSSGSFPTLSVPDAEFVFTRYKAFDEIPTDLVLNFEYDDCLDLCTVNEEPLPNCFDEICVTRTGINNPLPVDCSIDDTIDFDTPTCDFYLGCNLYFYYVDGSGITRCGNIPPSSWPSPRTECSVVITTSHRRGTIGGLGCLVANHPIGLGGGGRFFPCEIPFVCPNPYSFVGASFSETVSHTAELICNGPYTIEICVPSPTWSITMEPIA
jgi:hypothetical protein